MNRSTAHRARHRAVPIAALAVVALAAVLRAPAAPADEPTPSRELTGEERRGYPPSNVPPELRNLRRELVTPANAAVGILMMRSVDQVYETAPVRAGGKVLKLDATSRPLSFSYAFEGRSNAAQGFVDRSYTNGLLILKRGRIVHEQYGYKTTPGSRLQSSSMSKSLGGLLVGLALADGSIASIDDLAARYVPALAGTPYRDVTIRNLLEMRSGVAWDENFTVPGPSRQAQELGIVENVARFTDAAAWVRPGPGPGTVFNYNSLDSALIGLVIIKATGRRLADYMSERLWRPAGMESSGYWMLDGPPGEGQEFAAGGFSATLRDWGRLGLLVLNSGRANGRQVIPAEWMAALTSTARPMSREGATAGLVASEPRLSYGFQWYRIAGTQVIMALGAGGQQIVVDPATQTVIVKLSAIPYQQPMEREFFAFAQAALAWAP